MNDQLQALPMSQLDIAQAFLSHFDDLCERRLKAVRSASDKLTEAEKLRDMAAADVQRHSALATATGAAAAMKAGAEAAGIGLEFTAGGETGVVCEPPEVDPITGEVGP